MENNQDTQPRKEVKESKNIREAGPLTPATAPSAPLPATPAMAAAASPQRQIQIDPVKAAKSISLILHPFLVSPLSIVLILWLDLGSLLKALAWAGLCAAFVVAPAVFYLRDNLKQKKFTDADVSVREHRYGFYIFGGACMAACFVTLLWLDAPAVLIAGFTAALCALVAATITNRLWTKISIHAGAMAGVTVAAAFYSIPLAVILALGTLAVSWARLITKRHTVTQAIVAWAIAIICVVAVFGPML